MRILALLIGIALIFTAAISPCFANPFLACDPMTDDVTKVNVDLNGQTIHVNAADIVKQTDAWLLVDLSTIQAGSYTAKAQAEYGTWGVSDWSADFLFVKPVMTAPANMSLQSQ